MSVSSPMFTPSADRRNALDRAHRGDIEGALGTVLAVDTGPRTTLRRKLVTLLAVLGPGIVVMVADNDAGTISVFSQAGHDHGLGLLWVLLLLCPVLYITQEMVARLGAVTGAGHARLTLERFGRLWCSFSLADLLFLNLATLVTEFIGVAIASEYFGVSRYASVPAAALVLVTVTSGGSFRRWERAMYVMIAMDLVLVPLALSDRKAGGQLLGHVHRLATLHGAGPTLLLLVALVGSTIAPWQLFFQQSSVVDKRITPRWLNYERVDTAVGAILFAGCAGAVMIIAAAAMSGQGAHAQFTDVGDVLRAVGDHLGSAVGAVFAVALLNASLLCAAAVSLSGSYAIGEVLGFKHSLHRRFADARVFHCSFAGLIVVAAVIVLLPGLPLGAITILVQAITCLLLPSTLVLLLLLCNDEELLGPLRNGWGLNLIASATIAFILTLSLTLALTSALPHATVAEAALTSTGLVGIGGVSLLVMAIRGRKTVARDRLTPWQRRTWSSPPLELIGPPAPTRARVLTLVVVRSYVAVTSILLLVKLATVLIG